MGKVEDIAAQQAAADSNAIAKSTKTPRWHKLAIALGIAAAAIGADQVVHKVRANKKSKAVKEQAKPVY